VRIVGVDPGLKGAIALLDSSNGETEVLVMPVIEGKRPEYDLPSIKCLLNYPHTHVVVERPQPLPSSIAGTIANFHRGRSLGLWEALCCGMSIPVSFVSPRKWQQEMLDGIPGEDTKQRSLVAARRLFPTVDLKRTPRCTKLDDGFSDALLIAEYGRRHFTTLAQTASSDASS
jgi:hypothetical protein